MICCQNGNGVHRCAVSGSSLELGSNLGNCCVEFYPFFIKTYRYLYDVSLSAVRLLSSLELNIAAQMYQKFILHDMPSKEHRFGADVLFLA
jgi:hypothetical protein